MSNLRAATPHTNRQPAIKTTDAVETYQCPIQLHTAPPPPQTAIFLRHCSYSRANLQTPRVRVSHARSHTEPLYARLPAHLHLKNERASQKLICFSSTDFGQPPFICHMPRAVISAPVPHTVQSSKYVTRAPRGHLHGPRDSLRFLFHKQSWFHHLSSREVWPRYLEFLRTMASSASFPPPTPSDSV